MRALSSLSNRIFLASAVVAVLSIGTAVFLVNFAVTRRAEAELERSLVEAGELVAQFQTLLFEHLAREAQADCGSAAAEGGGVRQPPAHGAGGGGRVRAADRGRPLRRHQPRRRAARGHRRSRCPGLGGRRATGRQGGTRGQSGGCVLVTCRRPPARRLHADRDWPGSTGDPRLGQRRRRARSAPGRAHQGADPQRGRVRGERPRAGLHVAPRPPRRPHPGAQRPRRLAHRPRR